MVLGFICLPMETIIKGVLKMDKSKDKGCISIKMEIYIKDNG